MRITFIGSKGQLFFDSSIREFKYLAPNTILRDSPLAKILTRSIKAFSFVCFSFLTDEIYSYCLII